MAERIYLLIKIFDKEEYADAFVQKGELYCRTLGEFKRSDEEDGRGDRFEAVTDWHQADKVKLAITFKDKDGFEKTLPIEKLAGPVISQNKGYDRLNLYCMYAVKAPEFEGSYETEEERIAIVEKINGMLKEKITISDVLLSLGKFAVVVYQVEDFINRVKQAAQEKSFVCWNGLIGYYDPDTFHGSFMELESVFRKRHTYEHQSEYRFAFNSFEPEGDKFFHLGSLEDIAIKIPTREINDKLQLKLAD
ncbi:hypothetical protein [Azospira inquinata]|uniref:Uncharacterized protein n=1 Tax=Azospira inquinata TaxID=2785627 RepID=A0A975SL57_9RHOO|nr:hypothetical protein [Azospira inquinata]QWT46319.1 hypothetical protein J8L76_01005 [Azospira inquinata]QWT48354.1 hypothetical protein Azoinq_10860 [Azospira inquinata]